MAFFDEIGKKITKTGQDVFQKTKDTAESIKLGGMVSEEEKRIAAFYSEIGKAYYEMHADSYEPAFEKMVLGIKEAQAKIADYSEQIKRLKGVVRCHHCGGEVPYNAPFCSACGSKMNVQDASEQTSVGVKRCTGCGVPLADGVVFCTNCGTKVEETPAPAPQPEPVAQAKVCKNCGNPIEEGVAFCTECGFKIEG